MRSIRIIAYVMAGLSLLAFVVSMFLALGDIRPYENGLVDTNGVIDRSAFSEIDSLRNDDKEIADFQQEKVIDEIERTMMYHIVVKNLYIRITDWQLVAFLLMTVAFGLQAVEARLKSALGAGLPTPPLD